MSYQQCSRCIMDNASDETITFDKNGHCNYCNDITARASKEYFPNSEGKRKLEEFVEKIKKECKDDKYDCLVGVSGGIDSSYILYLGHQYGLRMLAVHVDDGLDNPVAVKNIENLINKTKADIQYIRPSKKAYADLLKSLFKASVPNLAAGQDNIIVKAMQNFGERNNIKYILDGNNFAHEGILERSNNINTFDKKYIISIQEKFGSEPLDELEFISLEERYLSRNFFSKLIHLRPLNYIDYNFNKAIQTLHEFSDFEYYGGKHYESILTRFMQCYYLPVKFGMDKRKSHYSSLIMSGQMEREAALDLMQKPLYPTDEMKKTDIKFLADYMEITVDELESYINLPPKKEKDYPHSVLNDLAPIARKFRKWIE